jgi:hypothetical protein
MSSRICHGNFGLKLGTGRIFGFGCTETVPFVSFRPVHDQITLDRVIDSVGRNEQFIFDKLIRRKE